MGQNAQAALVVIAQDVRHVYEYVTDKSVLTAPRLRYTKME